MTRSRHSIDGFIPRRPGGEPINRYREMGADSIHRRPQVKTNRPPQKDNRTLQRSKTSGLTRSEIDESLREIDDTSQVKKRRNSRSRRLPGVKKILKAIAILIAIIGISVGAWLGYKALSNMNNVFGGGILGLVQRKPLKQDANGRSNVLIFGTSEDSPDHNARGGEGGPLLTDSIMVLSVNQEKKDAFMVSIPRDLWVKFDEPCSVGWQEKINSVYQCGSDFGENPEAGAAALQKKVGEVLGLDIQYYAQIDYSVVKKTVDAVGGVDVTIESNPSGVGILDRNFDWRCDYKCYYVNYDDGEKVHLDGEHALALARARNANGGYGLANGNFDREKNQQKILRAVQEKALSIGTITNVGKVTELLDAMGTSLKTNVDKSEVQTIVSLATEVSAGAITSLDLYDPEAPLVRTGPIGNASAVYPVAGLFEYGKIRAFITKMSNMDAATKEGATISVLNGSGVFGAAQKEAEWLEEKGFTIGEIDNAPEGDYQKVRIYQRAEGMKATKAKLESLYGVKVASGAAIEIDESIDFVVIVGEGSPLRSSGDQVVQ